MAKKIDAFIGRCEEYLVGAVLLIVSALIFLNVVLRYVFGTALNWSDETVRYLMILLTFVGTSICVRKGSHISIDLILNVSSEKVKKLVVVFSHLVGLAFSLIIAWFGWRLVLRSVHFPQLSPALQIPMWVPYLSILVGFALSSLRYLQLLVRPPAVPAAPPVAGEAL